MTEEEKTPDTEPARKLETREEHGERLRTTTYAWAQELADGQRWVLHTPSRSVARVKSFYDGVDRVIVSKVNDRPVQGPVLELEDGNTFMAELRAFVSLTEPEVRFFMSTQKTVGMAAKVCAEQAAGAGMAKETALLLIGVALRATARVTDVVQAQPTKGG
jgi:hypothetical protein